MITETSQIGHAMCEMENSAENNLAFFGFNVYATYTPIYKKGRKNGKNQKGEWHENKLRNRWDWNVEFTLHICGVE